MAFIAELRLQCSDYFNSLALREQLLLISCSVVAALYLLLSVVLEPKLSERDQLRSLNSELNENIAVLHQAAADWQGLQIGYVTDNVIAESEVNRMIEQAVSKFGLKIKRFQPGNNNDWTVWLEKANFTSAAKWIHYLENNLEINLLNAKIVSAKETGKVDLQVRLKPHRGIQ